MGQIALKTQGLCCSQQQKPNSNLQNQQGKTQDKNTHNSTKNNNNKEEHIVTCSDFGPSKNISECSLQESQLKNDLSCFLKIKLIGQGAFGKVYTVKKNNPMSKKIYAMKIIKKTDIKRFGLQGYIKVERDVLQNNKHPFLVDLKYAFQTASKVYLVMEFVAGGSLYSYLPQVPKKEREIVSQFIFAQTVLGIEQLHTKMKVIYRDLKPENILVSEEGNIKLTDFGLSKIYNPENPQEKFRGLGGTQEYFAPEMISNQGWDRLVDIWGLGIFLYEILAGHCPFIPEQRKGVTEKFKNQILNGELQFPTFFSEQAVDIIKKLLQKDPQDRLGANDFSEIKEHDFFKGIDWKNIENLKTPSPIKKYVDLQLKSHNKTVAQLPPRPILETFIKDPQLQIAGLSYKPALFD